MGVHLRNRVPRVASSIVAPAQLPDALVELVWDHRAAYPSSTEGLANHWPYAQRLRGTRPRHTGETTGETNGSPVSDHCGKCANITAYKCIRLNAQPRFYPFRQARFNLVQSRYCLCDIHLGTTREGEGLSPSVAPPHMSDQQQESDLS